MLCEEKIHTQSPLESLAVPLAANQNPTLNGPHPVSTWPTPESVKLKSTDPEYHRLYRIAHREQFREYSRNDYIRNRERFVIKRNSPESKKARAEYMNRWNKANVEKRRLNMRQWLITHKAYVIAYRKAYRERRLQLYREQKERICARKRELSRSPKYRWRINGRLRERRRTDAQFALMDSMRASMNRAFRRNWIEKPSRTEAMFGCSISELKARIEQQFASGMSWSNRASFVIDHFIPIKAFDLRDREEALWAFNWHNLRPLTRHDNAVKSAKIPNPLPDWLPHHIAECIKARQA